MPQPSSNVQHFARQVSEFLDLRLRDGSREHRLPDLAHRVAALYATALVLQPPIPADVDVEVPPYAQRRRAWAEAFPRLGVYSHVLDPLEPHEPPELGVGDAIDDLADIEGELLAGLALFEAGQISEAEAHWGWTFRIHWGAHAANLIAVLHHHIA